MNFIRGCIHGSWRNRIIMDGICFHRMYIAGKTAFARENMGINWR